MYKSFHSEPEAPKSKLLSTLGKRLEATSALKATVSEAASPNVRLPAIVAVPVTVKLPPTATLPVVVIVSV